MKLLMIILTLWAGVVWAQGEPDPEEIETEKNIESLFGIDRNQKFSFHQPTYFIFGNDDLKLQFSFKYRLAKTFNLYFAYSQVMFWDIWKESRPFEDVNYRPELFYRLLETKTGIFQSFDIGWLHTSNGQDEEDSRSLDRVFVRSNIATKFHRHHFGAVIMLYNIYNEDATNEDIVDHYGYWDALFYLSDIVRIEKQRMDLEVRAYAGKKIYDLDQGAYQIGLVYRVGSDNFNPSIYFQRFEGYGENLLGYNKRRTEHRLGLMLYF
ncbi:phospholipase A [Peredibacter sp. HCB2-198]|uniref:phospholipase A n=1 Tax=Peredibacter sp. HCB2-198 TaxID=3383025 RepID=UPI0038B4486A